jgi:hypothetical protein
MFNSLQRYVISQSLGNKRSCLQNLNTEGNCSTFSVELKSTEKVNALMFDILTIQHDKTVHTVLRMEHKTLHVSIEHCNTSDEKSVASLIEEIDRMARKIKNG